jgi:hypothetical protein
MNRFWTGVVAVGGAVLLTTSAQAAGRGVHVSHSGSHVSGSHSYHWQGSIRSYNWSHHYWDRRYNCYLYWNPTGSCYYYYCAPQACYYPVSYCPYNTYNWSGPGPDGVSTPPPSVPAVTAQALTTVNVGTGTAPPPVVASQVSGAGPPGPPVVR